MTRRQIATRNVLRHMAGGIGLLMVGFGTFLVASYVVGAVQVMEEADRSWLFWGLALAGQGVAIGGLGGLLVVWGHAQRNPGNGGGLVPAVASAPESTALHVLRPDDKVSAAVE